MYNSIIPTYESRALFVRTRALYVSSQIIFVCSYSYLHPYIQTRIIVGFVCRYSYRTNNYSWFQTTIRSVIRRRILKNNSICSIRYLYTNKANNYSLSRIANVFALPYYECMKPSDISIVAYDVSIVVYNVSIVVYHSPMYAL